MTNILLIIVLVIAVITMISSVLTTVLVVSKSKEKDLVAKVLKILGVILGVIIVIALAVGISFVKGDKGSNKNNTTQKVSLSDAGFNEVDIDKYIELTKSSDKNIILIARPTCGYCEAFTPILKQVSEDMNLTINYVNTDSFSSDDWTTFKNSFEYLSGDEWGTPLVLIVKNGEIVDKNNGYVEADAIKSFFEKNGFGE